MVIILKLIFLDLFPYLVKDIHMAIFMIFIKKLKNPKKLHILGNGLQKNPI